MANPVFVNFVSIGRWNRGLFTGNWVSTNIFGQKEGDLFDAKFSPNEFDISYHLKGITVIPRETIIEFRIDEFDEIGKKVKVLNSYAMRLFQLLPHTPVTGSGFNLRYKITREISSNFLEKIRSSIKPIVDLPVDNISFRHEFKNYVRNTFVNSISDDRTEFDLNFNFHYARKQDIVNASFTENLSAANDLITK